MTARTQRLQLARTAWNCGWSFISFLFGFTLLQRALGDDFHQGSAFFVEVAHLILCHGSILWTEHDLETNGGRSLDPGRDFPKPIPSGCRLISPTEKLEASFIQPLAEGLWGEEIVQRGVASPGHRKIYRSTRACEDIIDR